MESPSKLDSCDSFTVLNSRVLDILLCVSNWFRSIEHTRRVIEEWRVDYNETRSHSSLDFLTPKEFAQKEEEDFTGKL